MGYMFLDDGLLAYRSVFCNLKWAFLGCVFSGRWTFPGLCVSRHTFFCIIEHLWLIFQAMRQINFLLFITVRARINFSKQINSRD